MYPGLLDSSRPQKVEIFVPLAQQSGSVMSAASENVPDGDNFDLSLGLPGGPSSPQDISPSSHPLGNVTSSSWKGGEVTTSPILSWRPGEVTTSSRKPSDVDDSPPQGPRNNTSPPQGRSDLVSPPRRTSDVCRPSDVVNSPRRPNDTSRSSGKSSDPQQMSKLSEASWEVLSKFSSTSHRLSIRQDLSDPHHKLVPLWECLQVHL